MRNYSKSEVLSVFVKRLGKNMLNWLIKNKANSKKNIELMKIVFDRLGDKYPYIQKTVAIGYNYLIL